MGALQKMAGDRAQRISALRLPVDQPFGDMLFDPSLQYPLGAADIAATAATLELIYDVGPLGEGQLVLEGWLEDAGSGWDEDWFGCWETQSGGSLYLFPEQPEVCVTCEWHTKSNHPFVGVRRRFRCLRLYFGELLDEVG